ncbi:hypothetical protein FAZ15_13190 [Sphingobacterium olei]|uniref:Uncharacterized protein n=1 Tax=Sphingobacterium olei TaxID=2571155 RepID=A0A4U0NYB0_9SPHI|nr:hypothetical protein [Sphingobacterium olei]TJZ59846.1 hypothetical protein FAZ15_13190 [Sphingobacterium olei]
MKNLILAAVFLATAWVGQAVYAQQGFGTNTPDKSAAVDIVSTKRGLLVPRIALEALNSAAPVTAPANSLFVYNTATTNTGTNDVTPGYYYWEAAGAKWVRFISSEDVKTTKVAAGENVQVEEETVGNETTYTVGVKAGDTDGLVLVTAMGDHDNDPATADQLMSKWVNPSEFVNDAIEGVNGITTTLNTTTNKVEIGLGGELDAALTTITTVSGSTDPANDRKLAIDGLEDVTAGFQADADGFVMVLTTGGVLQKTKLSSLVKADNGLTINDGSTNAADAGKVQLGGALNQVTTITADATNTLAIDGLQNATAANSIVVTEAGGVLRSVKRSLSAAIGASSTIGTSLPTDYSPYVQEVNIAVTLAASDIDLTLPDATVAEGQVINVKITNTDDSHSGYLNIISAAGTLTYGALPFQGWVLKSNGTGWLVVGRN